MTRAPGNGRASERRQALRSRRHRQRRGRAGGEHFGCVRRNGRLPSSSICRSAELVRCAVAIRRKMLISGAEAMRSTGQSACAVGASPSSSRLPGPNSLLQALLHRFRRTGNIARLNCNRGLTKDFETTVENTLSWLLLARVQATHATTEQNTTAINCNLSHTLTGKVTAIH